MVKAQPQKKEIGMFLQPLLTQHNNVTTEATVLCLSDPSVLT